MAKKATNTTTIVLIIIVLAVGAFFIFSGIGTDQFIETKLYDSDGNLINANALSIVNGVEGVAFVSFTINIENLDTVSRTFELVSISPSSVSGALPSGQIEIAPNQMGSFETNLIDIQSFEGTQQEFCITAQSFSIPALRASAQKTGCVTLDIQPNPEGGFNVDVESDLEDPGMPEPPGNGGDEEEEQPPQQPPLGLVNFRTTNINYGVFSEIAYSNQCGAGLIAYERVASQIISVDRCTDSPGEPLLSNLPCPSENTCYLGQADPNLIVCWQVGTNQYTRVQYNPFLNQSQATVDTSSSISTPSLELSC